MSRFFPGVFGLPGFLILSGLLASCASARHAEFRDGLVQQRPALAAHATLEVGHSALSTVKSIGLIGMGGREVSGLLRVPRVRTARERVFRPL
jgi:hypothetical protein